MSTYGGQNSAFPHLPPGRQPGAQSRGSRTASGLFVYLLPVAGVIFLLSFVPVGLLTGDLLFVAGGIAGAAAFIGGGFAFYRQRRPRIARHLRLATEALELRRGDTVGCRLEITDPDRVGERIEVGLVCTVRYDVLEHRGQGHGGIGRTGSSGPRRTTHQETAYEHWVPASRSERLQPFSLTLPADQPYSHEGSCLSFAWRVTAREPTALRSDPSRHQPIWVLP